MRRRGFAFGLLASVQVLSVQAHSDWQVNSYIDGSYNYLSQANTFISDAYNRVYDINPNGGTLHQLAGTLGYTPEQGLGAVVNGMIGHDAIVTNANGLGTWLDSNHFGVDLTQAYLQYTVQKWTFIAGKFLAYNGVETVDPTTDTNYSRAFYFGYGPFTLLGARLSYQPMENLLLIAGVNNGWDIVNDLSRNKTIELKAAFRFNSHFAYCIALYNGGQRAIDNVQTSPQTTRTLLNMVGTFNMNDQLTFILNYDYAKQNLARLSNGSFGKATWGGLTGYMNYQINEQFLASLRGERFRDKGGFRTGVNQTLKTATLSLTYKPKNHQKMGIRGELRRDFSDVLAYRAKRGPKLFNHMSSAALEVFVIFS